MKKLLSISILALLLVLVACQIKTTDTPPIEDVDIQLELSLNNEARGIDFLIDIKIESDLEILENIEVGLYYKLNATTEDLDNYLKLPGSNKLTTNQLKDEEVILSLNDVPYAYKDDYVSAYAEVTFTYNNKDYSFGTNYILTTNLYELALLSEGDFADEIISYFEPEITLPTITLDIDASLNNEAKGFDVVSHMTSSSTLDAIEGYYGLLYIINYDGNLTKSTAGVDTFDVSTLDEIKLNHHILKTFSDVVLDYVLDRVYMRAYFTYTVEENTYTVYSDTINFNLYELALLSEGSFAELIIEQVEYQEPDDHEVKHISVEVDTLAYTVVEKPEFAEVIITTNYIKVTVEITLNEDYIFADTITFKFNGEVIRVSLYELTGHKLTYQFDDPNWSGIY